MYNFHPAYDDTAPPIVAHANNDQDARLNPFTRWNAEAERHARLFRNAREVEQLRLIMARGGMIDARHFWPLACGVVFTITALILSPNLYPY
ncbi:MAG: hypothetical protein LC747_03925 [Acidobacteria bacterium]|nr:hypothetical protein [Acidobacteriota bacterium]